MENKIEILKKLIEESNNIVFFGGAGVSTESGIPDFRSKDGLYNQKYKHSPETILSRDFFIENMEEFYKFYKEKMNCLDVNPNITHYALAKLEEIGKLKSIITQNIDGLHQKAGSKKVYELHGSVWRNYCTWCRKPYTLEEVYKAKGIPQCSCGGIVKPDVVLYEEGLDDRVVMGAVNAIEEADTLIVGGTSLTVYPAAGLLRYFGGKHLIVINRTPTSADKQADLIFTEDIGKVFAALKL